MNVEQIEQEQTPAAAEATGETLQRTNLMLTKGESEWLDAFAAEILATGGAKVSRSEIVRAALVGLRELHKSRAGIFADMGLVKQPSHLEFMTLVAARAAAQQWAGWTGVTNGQR